jgi:hypothetical protein
MQVRAPASVGVLRSLKKTDTQSLAGDWDKECLCYSNLLGAGPCWYNAGMTLMEITYELQSPLQPEQLRALGSFANTYGLRRFRLDENTNRLSFEYDASRLKETEVEHVLREARIPVLGIVKPVATVSQI